MQESPGSVRITSNVWQFVEGATITKDTDMTVKTTKKSKSHGAAEKIDMRSNMLRIGMAIFTQKGFHNVGLDELVQAAGMPKGSFYYYFKSKDAFVLEVIKNYGDYLALMLARHLEDASKPNIERLRSFCEDAIKGVKRYQFTRGCLIGNLGQEMGALDDAFRNLTHNVLKDWRQRVQECIEKAMEAGEIDSRFDARELAEFFWSAWEGSVLCAKLERSTKPMETVVGLFVGGLLGYRGLHEQTARGRSRGKQTR